MNKSKITGFKKKGYLWATLLLFLISITLHWSFAWISYKQEQNEHNQPVEFSDYFSETMRDTMENWQSEFLQLIWQVAGLSFLYYVGSPSSKEGDDRKEAKLDFIIKELNPEKSEKILADFEKKFPKN
jgi:hypothetical protein